MKKRNHKTDEMLDETLAAIRDEAIDAATIDRAAKRVWSRVAGKQTGVVSSSTAAPLNGNRSCVDFQSMIPEYLGASLAGARLLLLEDHTRECLACRRAIKQARAAKDTATMPLVNPAQINAARNRAFSNSAWKWTIAAMFAVAVALAAVFLASRASHSGEASGASLLAANGTVYRVGDAESRPLNVGDGIRLDERIRTAKDARAVVRLKDGSLVEMKERSEFSLSDTSKGTTINLARGDVIVQAAKQREKHLYVSTNDCLVSVTGTIFAVGNGTKGSRVSVVEGEVHVDQPGRAEQILHSGDQALTNESLEPIPVKDDINWSKDAGRYTSLLAEFASLRKELNARVPRPGVRYSTRLLDAMPEGTVLYAALPNLGATISESYKVMQERINGNAALREWWEKKNNASAQGKPGLNEIIARVRDWGAQLGDEIAVSATINAQGQPEGALVLAELRDPANVRTFLEEQLRQLQTIATKNEPVVNIIDDPLASSFAGTQGTQQSAQPQVFVWLHDDLIAVALDVPTLRKLAATLDANAAGNSFKATAFYSRIASLYKDGAGLVVAADLQKIVPQLASKQTPNANDGRGLEAARQLGLFNLKDFILEQKQTDGKTHSRAVLSFDDMHHGIQSWLAAPGPMGSLEYISPDASVVAAFVVKNPVSLVDDLLGSLRTLDPQLLQHLNDFEHEHAINFRNDFAAPLGGEFAFTVDGPVLPTPSWKMIFEVYDSQRLQQTFERAVAEMNKYAAQENRKGFAWEHADAGAGRTFYTLRSIDFGLEINYTFADGYMIVAPSRALVDRALRFHEARTTLLHAPRFVAALPQDGAANFSAIFYHNLAPLLEPLAQRVANSAGNLPKEQGEALRQLAATTAPTLAYARAENDGIIFATDSEDGSPFGLSPATLLGIPGAFGIEHILEESMNEKAATR
ncbi:MAG: FecR domain-containing protein [Pyrinomonadaceae bacterium]